MNKIIKGWEIGFIYMDFTYAGLLEGRPSAHINEDIIKYSNVILKSLGYNEDCVNIFESKLNENTLKPIRLIFELFNYDPEIKCYVITFFEENEKYEDVIERIINTEKLKTVEWNW